MNVTRKYFIQKDHLIKVNDFAPFNITYMHVFWNHPIFSFKGSNFYGRNGVAQNIICLDVRDVQYKTKL